MANAQVEKLKAFGIRHGEKVVVGLTATLFVVLTALAIIKPTLEMKPAELSKAASDAQSNIQRKQDEKDILAKLEKDGLKDPNFEKVVENQLANALKPGDYRSRLDWVTPEPGAGLIRDQPELIAPTELAAFPGRGGLLMYALDDKGERKIATPEEAKKKPTRRRRSRPSAPGMGGSAMGGSGGGIRRPAEDTAEAKRRRELEEAKRKAAFTPLDKSAEKGKEAAPEEPTTEGPWKEETRGKRWVVITGVIDNAKLKKNYLLALKNEAIAYPNYRRLDVERQSRQEDSTWSDWEAVDQDKNYEVLDNLPEIDAEYVPESQRPTTLVDALPFLRAGYWTGVHVARLVPPEILAPPKKVATGPGGYDAPMRPGGIGGGSSAGGDSAMSMPGAGAMRPGGSGSGGMPMGDVGGSGVNADETNFKKYDDPNLMIRSLDFTVEAHTTYRFRVRIVVVNPNKDHEDVNPGVDTTSNVLKGPWSEPTDEVTVPADIAAYAMMPESTNRRDDLVQFQVVRWDPISGQTLIKNDTRSPGELVGEFGTILMPNSEGTGPKSTSQDFNSRAIVLDMFGGRQMIPDIGLERNKFEVPALAMLVEPDGSVVIRSQAGDKTDEVRKDMEANYQQAIKDSEQERDGGSRVPGSGSAGKKKKKRR